MKPVERMRRGRPGLCPKSCKSRSIEERTQSRLVKHDGIMLSSAPTQEPLLLPSSRSYMLPYLLLQPSPMVSHLLVQKLGILPPSHAHQTFLLRLQRSGLRAYLMVAVLHRRTVTESAGRGHLLSTAHLLIRSFAEDSRTPRLQRRQELPTASPYSEPTSFKALAATWGRLLPIGGLRLCTLKTPTIHQPPTFNKRITTQPQKLT